MFRVGFAFSAEAAQPTPGSAGHVFVGPVSVAVGASELTVNVRESSAKLVAASVARTVNVCDPPPSSVVVNGDVQGVSEPRSSLHSSRVWPVAVNVNVGVGSVVVDPVVGFVMSALVPLSGPIATVGFTVSIENERWAVAELPASSVALTSRRCGPSASEPVIGEVHAPNAAVSNRHCVLVPVDVNPKVGVLSFVGPEGPVVIATRGSSVSTVKLRVSVFWLPAVSLTRTVNVCEPSGRALELNGDVQAANAAASTWQAMVDGAPVVVNVKMGVLTFVGPLGPDVIVTVGPVVTTLKVRESIPMLPAASVTRTSNVCPPGASAVTGVNGEEQPANAPASKRHCVSIGEPPVTNVNVGRTWFVGPLGPLWMATVGDVVSTVKLCEALAWFSATSRTRTSNECKPSERAGVVNGEVHAA